MTHNMSPTQVLIATKQAAHGRRLQAALESAPEFHVLGHTAESLDMLTLTRELNPDVLLLDSALACDLNGAARSLSAVRVILIVPAIDRARVLEAIRLEARGILPKGSPPQAVVRSIRRVMAGDYSIDADGVAVLVQILRDSVLPETTEFSRQDLGLTARERDVVGMVASGNSNRQIAQRLSISERTVKHHLTAVFEKLRVSSRLELAVYAAAHSLSSAKISQIGARMPNLGSREEAACHGECETHVFQSLRHS